MHNNIDEIPIELFRFQPAVQAVSGREKSTVSLTFMQDAWRRLRKNKAAVAAMALLLVILVFAFLAPVLAPYGPNVQNIPHANLPPLIPGVHINGLNGRTLLQGEWVDRYALARVPKD